MRQELKAEKTTSIFIRGMKASLKKELDLLKKNGGYRTYIDLLEDLVKLARGK